MKTVLSLILAGSSCVLFGGAPSIGIVKSVGDFRVNGSLVHGNGTVFEGNVIETSSARSVVNVGQSQITLLPDSRARVYSNHAVLEKGAGLVRGGQIEAATLNIAPADKNSLVQVQWTGGSSVSVFSQGGPAQVRNSRGMLVASVLPGMGLALTPQQAQAAAKTVDVSGQVKAVGNAYLLTDRTNKITVEVQHREVSKFVNQEVHVIGVSVENAKPANGASLVVAATSITPLKATGATKAAGAGAAAGGAAAGAGAAAGGAGAAGAAAGAAAAGAATAAGVSAATTIAVVGGVTAAAATGALAATGNLPGQGDNNVSQK